MSFVLICLTIISFFFGCIFIIKKNENDKSYKYLSLLYFLVAFLVLTMVVVSKGETEFFSDFFVNLNSLLFYVFLIAIPPTFYFYCAYSSPHLELLKRKRIANHYYIVFTLLLINILCFLYLSFNEENDSLIYSVSVDVMNFANGFTLLFIFPLLNIYYCFNALKKIRIGKKQNKFKQLFTNWIFLNNTSYVLFIILVYILVIGQDNQVINILIQSSILIYLCFLGLINLYRKKFISSFMGMSNTHLSSDDKENEKIICIRHKIEKFIQNEDFTNNDLTINTFSKSIGYNSKIVSKVLKTEFNSSFPHFINFYRIQKAKAILSSEDQKKYTVDSIGQSVGFNSKSSFYTTFKKHTGQTPKEFREIEFR